MEAHEVEENATDILDLGFADLSSTKAFSPKERTIIPVEDPCYERLRSSMLDYSISRHSSRMSPEAH